MTNFEDDPRFSPIPEKMQQQLAELSPTGEMEGLLYHEVGFRMGNITCQAAVVNCKWVALTPASVAQLNEIEYVFDSDLQKQIPTPFPGLIDRLRQVTGAGARHDRASNTVDTR